MLEADTLDRDESLEGLLTYLSGKTSLDIVQKKKKTVDQESPGLSPSLDRKG